MKNDMRRRCPGCAAQGLVLFHEAEDVPVQSCLLMDSREEALGFPRGELRLGFCPTCGLISNTRFDPKRQEFSSRYEETQGFSPHFKAFLDRLVRKLIATYDLRQKRVLEIGCGKGEFLVLLCEVGANSGIGFDPSYVPERTSSEATGRVRFVQDFYSEKYSDVSADCVCCRHTLEHVAATGEFLEMVRRTIGPHPDTLVFFEVPDVVRILGEGAFWDVYYEHCSYFSPGSLARLFRKSGFEVLDLWLDYDDQYLFLTARPASGPESRVLDREEEPAVLREGVEHFASEFQRQLRKWKRFVEEGLRAKQRTVLWGSGSKAVSFLTTLGLGAVVDFVVDINPHKQGKFLPGTGQEIVAPEFLKEYKPDRVVVMNPVYSEEIRKDLQRLGVDAEMFSV